jgi:hypothetical protein
MCTPDDALKGPSKMCLALRMTTVQEHECARDGAPAWCDCKQKHTHGTRHTAPSTGGVAVIQSKKRLGAYLRTAAPELLFFGVLGGDGK